MSPELFFLFWLPLIINLLLVTFYAIYADKEKSYRYFPRLIRWLVMVLSVIPVLSMITTIMIIMVFVNGDTKFKDNKIKKFFIDN